MSDIADVAQQAMEGSQKMATAMSAGTNLQAGKEIQGNTQRDQVWHERYPETVSPGGHPLMTGRTSGSGKLGTCGTISRE